MRDNLETDGCNGVAPSLTRPHFHPREPHTPTAGEQDRCLIYRYFRVEVGTNAMDWAQFLFAGVF